MQPEMLFAMALGITPPWEVTEVAFSKELNRLGGIREFQGQYI
jgi:transposase